MAFLVAFPFTLSTQLPTTVLFDDAVPLPGHPVATFPALLQGQVDDASRPRVTQHPGQIELTDCAGVEGPGQLLLGGLIQSDSENTAGGLIQPMYLIGFCVEQIGQGVPEAGCAAAVSQQRDVGWLVNDCQPVIAVDDFDFDRLCPLTLGA